ncbi:UNVERIFIED_CONTAM: hypothetical protein Slati_2661800 [Sesamum latifolium]|uniref:Retrotransposon gag domain-containing protein n=1 Tax=Sesamum latifolium TaxID=2727402 RepID=A0AAW2VZ11_9LAMI
MKDNEPLKEYLQRFNTAALEVPSATQEVKASAFSQGLLDGDFFKSLAKKPVSKFDALLARAAKYINMEDAQAAKKESRGEKRKDAKEETPSKKPQTDSRERKAPYQRINAVYTPLTVPITQALMAVEGKGLLARPRSWRDGPQRPQSDKFCRFHNNYGHTTEECRHLKNEIERLIQNGYLQEYVCWEKARGRSVSKERNRQDKGAQRGQSGSPASRESPGGDEKKMDPNNVPRKGIIRMITGGPVGGDSHHARKAEIRRAHSETITEVLDVEATEETPVIQFGRAERSGPRSATMTPCLRSNAARDAPLEEVNTSLYGFAGEVVHPRGLISLPLTLGTGPTQKTCTEILGGGDVPSAYNVILGRPTLNMFQAVISMYHMKIKFPTPGGVGEVRETLCNPEGVMWKLCERTEERPKELLEEPPREKRSREGNIEGDLDTNQDVPPRVQPAEELLNIELVPGDSEKTTRIGSQINETLRGEVIECLRRNLDVFAWTPQDLEGIDPGSSHTTLTSTLMLSQ